MKRAETSAVGADMDIEDFNAISVFCGCEFGERGSCDHRVEMAVCDTEGLEGEGMVFQIGGD